MATEQRVHTIAYDKNMDKIGETISKPMTDFYCDCSANEELLWHIYDWDCSVQFSHKTITVDIPVIPDISKMEVTL